MNVSSPSGLLFNDTLVRVDPKISNPTLAAVSMVPAAIVSGPFLLSTPSNSGGAVTFDFLLSQVVPTNDRIKLNIVVVLEQDTRESPTVANEFWLLSMLSYNMPVTSDSNRGISSP